MSKQKFQIKPDPALHAIENKHNCLLITGNIFDLQVEAENNVLYYRPLYLAEKMYEQGKFVLRYSRSTGLSVHRYSEIKQNKNILDDILQRTGLNRFVGNKDIRPTEVVEIFRGFKSIATTKHSVPFVFIIDYVPHLTAGQTADREMQIVAETINDIASLPSVQKAENQLIVYAYDENNLSPLLKVLHKIDYGYPDVEEYNFSFLFS